MALPSIKNRVGMTVTGTPGTGTITLNAADTGYQSFSTAYAADANVDILIEEGNTWEIARDCTYTNSGTTVGRGTLEASSTGSAVSFTSAAKVYVINSAERINHATQESRAHIEGINQSFSSTTAIAISAGKCSIRGKLFAYAGATLTSGSTMLDLSGSTVTLSASASYYIYAFDDAGTFKIAIVRYTGSGEGAVPVWDTDVNYWKAPSTGIAARRIGKFWTDSSSLIIPFYCANLGSRVVTMSVDNVADLAVLANGTATTATSITATPWLTSDDIKTSLGLEVSNTGSTTATLLAYVSINGGTTYQGRITMYTATAENKAISLRPVSFPYLGTLHYWVAGSGARCSIIILGADWLR